MEVLTEILRNLFRGMAYTWEAPKLFGWFHCIMSTAMILAAIVLYRRDRSLSAVQKKKRLFTAGVVLTVSEVWKQLFIWFNVSGEVYNWWYFPFQLCSMPMYLCLILPLCRRGMETAVLRFLGSCGIFAALCALAFPVDMLRVWPLLTMHGFLWHGVMIYTGLISLSLSPVRKWQDHTHPILLLLVLACAAEVINSIGTAAAGSGPIPDMFYISPYIVTQQPVFHDIAVRFGNTVEIMVYMTAVAVLSYGTGKYISLGMERRGTCRRSMRH